MPARKSRLIIFSCWLGTLAACILTLFVAVPLRGDIAFQWQDAFQLATPITSLYVPILTAFALFWFHPGATPNKRRLSGEKWLPALALTLFFQLFFFIGVVGIVHFSTPSPDSNIGLFEQISGLVHWISIFSPIAMAPAAFLLGVERIEVK